MRVLTLNCGSSSLKFDVIDVEDDGATASIASGIVEGIGGQSRARLVDGTGLHERDVGGGDHGHAFEAAKALLADRRYVDGIEAVGHRVVHGGTRFQESARMDAEVVEAIRGATILAPLHNQPALDVIEAARESFGPRVPMVAAFDTAFFAGLPESAWRYALPRAFSDRYGIRRFGFHGLAHGYMASRFRGLRPEAPRPRLVTLQLGSGCSATASVDGKPVDTSMGYTPLEGLIMSTRSGDLDPALPLRLQELTGTGAGEVETLLNRESGLLGLSGRSGDIRDLLEAAGAGDGASAVAVEAFCNRIRKYVGGYMAVMGGADAIVFGGGIGENSAEVRRRVCSGFEWAGLSVDEGLNDAAAGPEARISSAESRVEAWVMRVDEAAVIARETVAVLAQDRTGGDHST